MKKTILILGMVMLLVLVNTTYAFADAITYDMEPAGYYVYVATPDGGLNMRYGPGTDYSKVMEERIPDNVRLYIGYVSGNWGYTSYNGNEGWVALKQTTTEPPAPETPQPEAAGYYVYVATPDGGLNLRQGPGTDHAKVMEDRIPDNVRLYIESVSQGWGYTSYNGNTGWVALNQTTTNPPAAPADEQTATPADESQVTEPPAVDTDAAHTPTEDAEVVNNAMLNQLVLAGILVVLVIIIAILTVIIINLKSKR